MKQNHLPIISKILDLVYAPKCVACGKTIGTNYICKACSDKVDLLCVDSYAPVHRNFSHLWVLAAYEGPWMEVIHKFKYGKDRTAHRVIFDVLKDKIEKFYYVYCIITVPLHRWRYIKRGYNQSTIIAKMISKILSRPIYNRALVKSVNTSSQVGQTLRERRINLRSVFKQPRLLSQSVKDKNILLVDDVVTSGATVDECSKIIRRAGARRIDVLTLAKTL